MKKKIFGNLLCFLMAGTMVFGLAACDPDNGGEGGGGGGGGGTPTEDTSTPLASTATIYLVGDSTVCNYAELDMEYLPRSGYGTQLINYLNAQSSQIKNLALSGRSSLSFKNETNYATLTNNIKSGDYLIIGFGHNDEKVGEADRYTDPTGSYTEATKNGSPSFQYTLYENYIKVAKEAGATPILCTPIVRCNTKTPLEGDKVHNTATGNYAEAIKQLAADTDTALIDLTSITKTIYEADITEAQYYHRHSTYAGEKPNETPAGIDNTHLNAYGAKVVAYALLHNIPNRTDCAGLKASVKTNVAAPTHANDYASAIHPTYTRPNYSAPVLSNPIYTTKSGEEDVKWYEAIIGDNGGTSKHSATYNSSTGTFTVGNTGNQGGKITSGGDGFGAAVVQIPISKNFEISATVKVTKLVSEDSKAADNQSAFGIMLRDDMYVTSKGSALKANFAAVGAVDATAASAIFYRRAESLKKESDTSTTISTEKTYQLTLKRNGQKTTLEFDDGTNEYTVEYMDFAMNSIDGDYMYICLFATRCIVADFSNVVLTFTGDQTQED